MNRTSLVLVLVAFGCSAQQRPDPGSHGVKTPLGSELEAKEATTSANVGGATRLSLETFSPILLRPEFAEARRARAEERPADAVRTFRTALQQLPEAERTAPDLLLQLGRLQEEAKQLAAATESYVGSATQRWPLQGYAAYFAGRAALGRGDPALAMRQLQTVEDSLPVPVALHRGEAAMLLGDRATAVRELRAFLGSAERPSGWVRASNLLARLLSEPSEKPTFTPQLEDRLEALRLVRRVVIETAGSGSEEEATVLEAKLLGALSPEAFEKHSTPSSEDQLVRIQALSDARRHSDVLVLADDLLTALPTGERFGGVACEARVLRNKALAGTRKWGAAVDAFTDVLRRCEDPDLRARALFLAGRYAASDKRYSKATQLYAQLEKEAPTHRLADDARLNGANAFLELGDGARFTALLSTIAEDYPDGDMSLDGTFDLALRQIEKSDWGGAANVLERGMAAATRADQRRDHEVAGRERYFRARAWIETGEQDRGLDEYAALVRERPLSYYMQLAYSRLAAVDLNRARRELAAGVEQTIHQPFEFGWRPEFDAPAFERALQLLKVGEIELAAVEIESLGAVGETAAPELLWAVALLYERAGSTNLSQQLLRGRLTDWLGRWPVGDWRKAWELAFPRPHHATVTREATKNGLNEALVYAVMREESVFDARAVSHADAYGLMQLIEPTAQHFAKKLGMPYSRASLLRPKVNIALGAKVLQSYSDRFPNNPLLGIPSYNAGPGRPKRWLRERPNMDFDVWVEAIPFRETRRYTKRVLASRGAYMVLYDAPDADWTLPVRLDTKDVTN